MTKYKFKENCIYCGDNIKVLPNFPDECIDLIYIDPPFNSNKNYGIIWGNGYELKAYDDKWEGGILHYIGSMKPTIEQIYRVLKNTGTFYIHCDYHANAHLRIMCDEIFKERNFREEIIWYYKKGMGSQNIKNKFAKAHDTIYRYTKSDDYTFNMQYYDEITERMKKLIKTGYNISKHPNKTYLYYYGTKAIGKIDESQFDVIKHVDLSNYKKKYTDVFEFNFLNSQAKENLGYPTQKPEALMEKIISASSNKGDLVLDAFCGCGTTIAVAKRLQRKWIGIDVSPVACKVMAKRIGYNIDNIIGMKYTVQELKRLKAFDFQKWAVETLGGKVSKKLTRDMGIDGKITNKMGSDLPIEVKQHSVSRPDIDKFETVLRRTKKKVGYIIGLGKTEDKAFSKTAIEEIARCKKEDKLTIIPITVRSLLKRDVLDEFFKK